MKKILALSLVAIMATALTAFAPTTDSSFEGVIKFSITVDGANNPRMAEMMKNSTFAIYMAPGKSKSVMAMSMGTSTSINGLYADSAVVLSDFGQQKSAMKVPLNGATTGKKAPDIKYVDETKQIAVYTCHKAEIKNDDGSVTDLYYTDQLPMYQGKNGEYKGLKGFPLEFTSVKQGMTITFVATSVTKQALPGDTFTIPAGYTMQAMPQGGMHQGMGGH